MIFVFIYKTDKSKQVKQEVNCRVILPPLVFPDQTKLERLARNINLLKSVLKKKITALKSFITLALGEEE